MSKKVIILGLLLSVMTVFFLSTFVSAKPNQYGPGVYGTIADRIRVEDGDKYSIVHSTTKDPITGLGQDNKWCAL